MKMENRELDLHIEVVQDLTLDCFKVLKENLDTDSREILATIRGWAYEFDKKYGTEFPDGDYLDKLDFFALRRITTEIGFSEIEKRIWSLIDKVRFEKVVAFALNNGAEYGLIQDKGDFVVWITRYAKKSEKIEFLNEFYSDWGDTGLRVCSTCGKFMTEGYLLGDEYACSDECAWKSYKMPEEEAKAQFSKDLEENEDDFFWTEWEQSL